MPQPGETPQAYAVASTKRTTRWPSIPNAALMETIGRRVANCRTGYVEAEGSLSVKPDVPQPQRTDLEEQVSGAPVEFIPIKVANRGREKCWGGAVLYIDIALYQGVCFFPVFNWLTWVSFP